MFDSHCHLQDERIYADVDGIVSDAVRAGVRRVLCCGCSQEDWADVVAIGRRYDEVICAYGVHPWYADRVSGDWELALENCLKEDPAAAVGEIGLDYAVGSRNDAGQIDVFKRQLSMASTLERPVSIHCRKAWGDLLALLRGMGGLRHGGAIHSYSGAPDLVGELEKLGCCISFSGSILNVRNKRAAESLTRVSPDRLLIETDSPDILPPQASGPHNVPANLRMVSYRVASILGRSEEEVAALTYRNATRLFGARLCRRQFL